MATELRSSTRHRSIICVRLPPFKRIIDDEVHDPCHGVRAIDRCSAAGEHIDALEQGSRDRVDIDRIAEAERNGARSVAQSEGAVLPAVTQESGRASCRVRVCQYV